MHSPLDILSGLTIGYSKTLIVLPIKPIPLESLKSHRSSHGILEINKTIIELSTLLSLLFDKSRLDIAWIGPEDMSNLSLMTVIGNSINIKTTGCIGGNIEKLCILLLILVR